MIELYKQSIAISERMIELYEETAKNTEKVTYLYKESVNSTEKMIRYWQDLIQNPLWPPRKEGGKEEEQLKEKEKEGQMDNNYIASDVEKSNSTQSIPHKATKLKKQAKVTVLHATWRQNNLDPDHHAG